MTGSRLLSAAAASLLLADLVAGFALPEPDLGGKKVVGMNFHKELHTPYMHRRLRTRDSVTADITNYDLLYLINVTIGTPPQSFGLQLDTGSSDIWFPYASSSACRQSYDGCTTFGGYQPGDSSTYKLVSRNEFQISYVDGSQIDGDYVQDTLRIGSTTVTDMTMAAASQADRSLGIMGIGYKAGESSAYYGTTYPNIINELKTQGHINSLSYSLWLNDLESNEGQILFGGVDTEKYTGDLTAIQVQKDGDSGTFSSFTVALTGMNIVNGDNEIQYSQDNIAIPVILDSGTSLTYLPDSIANDISSGVGATNDQQYGLVVPCSLGSSPAKFSFKFGSTSGPSIEVEISQFVTPLITLDYSQPSFPNGDLACTWGIQPAGNAPNLFGDTFLRAAYVVYDLEDNTIAIAQTNFNSTSSNIEEISSGSIPGVGATASGAAVTQTASGVPLQTGFGGGSGSGTAVNGQASATFNLGGGAAATSSGAATSNIGKPMSFGIETVITVGTVLVGLAFGGGMIFVM